MQPRSVRSVLIALVVLVCAACHPFGDVRVLSLSFEGARTFDESELTRILATRESGWLPWSTKRYFDRAEFEADLKRISAFYSDRGFPDARLLGVDVELNAAKDGVHLRIRLDEGVPVIVDEVRFEGFEELPADVRARLKTLPLQRGSRRDRDLVRATREAATAFFRQHGFPLAVVDAGERPGSTPNTVIVSYRAEPGPAMTFGAVTVAGLERLDADIIRRELAVSQGRPFDERLVAQSQRRLAGLELIELAVVTPRLDAPDGTTVPITVAIAEGKPRQLQLGVGYGTEEQARGSLSWQHLNFFGGAKQATVDLKASAIDRGLRVGLIAPYMGRPGLSLLVSGGAWRTEHLTYDSQTYGGRVTLAYRTDRGGPLDRAVVQYRARVTYANEYLRYGIRPEFLADQSRRAERIALGLDPDNGRASGTLSTVEFEGERIAVDNPADPGRGIILSGHLGVASPSLGGTYRYSEIGGEARAFLPVGAIVLAGRLRAGTIAAADPLTVPFARRYFLGGSTSLRGWGRFQVSPLDAEGLPVGGRSVFETSIEARIPVRDRIGVAVFADGGNVWANDWTVDPGDLRWSAGVGVRYLTPVGALRLDVARQLTPIAGLVADGQRLTRMWRLHFSIGHSF